MKQGFATLFIVIILGMAALVLSLWLASSSSLSLRDGMNEKKSVATRALVSACAEVALEAMRETNSFTGTDSVVLNGGVCSYTVTDTGGSDRTIDVTGTIDPIVRKLQILTNAFNPVTIVSWTDVP